MQGTEQRQPTSEATPGRAGQRGRPLRNAPARLAYLAAVLLALVAWPPAAAHAISFTAPTSFAVPPFNVAHGLQSVAIGDFNRDSDPDLAVAHQDGGKISVLLGGAGGTFTGPTDYGLFGSANPLSVAVGKLNGDSNPDLVVANEGSADGTVPGGVSVLLGAADGSFTGPTNYSAGIRPQSVAVGEFNGDPYPDLAVVNESCAGCVGVGAVSVMLGAAGGTFTAPTNFVVGSSPQSVVVGDFNGDSDPDLAVANKLSNDVSVLLGGPGGSFTGPTTFPAGSGAIAVALGKFNADSDPDLAVVNELSNDVSVLLGGAGGTFSTPTNYAVGSLPDAVAVGELNGNSAPDLVVANQATDNVSVLLGGALGSFTGPTNFVAGDGPTSVAVGDFNGDSYPDLAVTVEISNNVSILLATPPETTIDSGPSALTNDSTPTFTFSSNDLGSTFQCRLNGGAFAACASPRTTAALPDGAYTFEVRATDDAGRTDPTPAPRSFIVDTAPPSAPTLSGTDPGSPANDNNPKVKGSADATSTVKLYTTSDCSGSPAAIGTPAAFAAPGLQTSVPDNSTTTFHATATDQAGNVSSCSSSSITYREISPPPPPPPVPPPSVPPPSVPPAGGILVPPGGGGLPVGGVGIADTSGPAMAVSGTTVKLDTSGAVPALLSCPPSEPAGCAGTLSLETLGNVLVKKAGAGARKRKVKLGYSFFRVAGGSSAAVKVRLSKKNQRLVRKLGKVRVLAIIAARDQAGNAKTSKQALTLRATKAKGTP